MIDRPARNQTMAIIRDFLNDAITCRQLEEREEDIGTKDPLVKEALAMLWFFYDDFIDHKVSLNKARWDYLQRMLLLLESDVELKKNAVTRREWRWDHALAATTFLLFVLMACLFKDGVGIFLFLPLTAAVVYGIERFREKKRRILTTEELACMPFESRTQIRNFYRRMPHFRKQVYRKESGTRRLRSEESEVFYGVLYYPALFLLSPLQLIAQSFPERESMLNDPLKFEQGALK